MFTTEEENKLRILIQAFENGKKISDLQTISEGDTSNLLIEVMQDQQSKKASVGQILQKGIANGVATLGNDGKVPASQLPDMQLPEESSAEKTLELYFEGSLSEGETGLCELYGYWRDSFEDIQESCSTLFNYLNREGVLSSIVIEDSNSGVDFFANSIEITNDYNIYQLGITYYDKLIKIKINITQQSYTVLEVNELNSQSGSLNPNSLETITTVDNEGVQYTIPIFDANGNTKKISALSLHKEGERVLPSNLSLPCLNNDWTLKSGWQNSFATERGWGNWQSLVNSLAANDPSNPNKPGRNGTVLTLSGIINGKRVVVYPQYYEAWAEQGTLYLYGVLNLGTITITSTNVTVLQS